ncbi:MAG: hypothetical protein ACR2O4_06760, partial [Hyphomicrobiaceae bacterium]
MQTRFTDTSHPEDRADRTPVHIRPIRPGERACQQAFFRRLSANARYNRFMTAFAELPASLLDRYCDLDGRSHYALLAEVTENGRTVMIGEARYMVDGETPARCEFAISVSDDWQGMGVG